MPKRKKNVPGAKRTSAARRSARTCSPARAPCIPMGFRRHPGGGAVGFQSRVHADAVRWSREGTTARGDSADRGAEARSRAGSRRGDHLEAALAYSSWRSMRQALERQRTARRSAEETDRLDDRAARRPVASCRRMCWRRGCRARASPSASRSWKAAKPTSSSELTVCDRIAGRTGSRSHRAIFRRSRPLR